jgi:hypothetical protein
MVRKSSLAFCSQLHSYRGRIQLQIQLCLSCLFFNYALPCSLNHLSIFVHRYSIFRLCTIVKYSGLMYYYLSTIADVSANPKVRFTSRTCISFDCYLCCYKLCKIFSD